jgi:hypothetical protein
MDTTHKALRFAATTSLCLLATPALAQNVTTYVPEKAADTAKKSEVARQGWDGMLRGAASVSIAQNSSVVGQVDGFSMLVGFNVTGGLDYLYDAHELRNTFSITENFARTPVMDEFLKTNDVFQIESIYNYFFLDWLGPYARLEITTNLLPTEDIQADPVDYVINRADGSTETINARRLELNGSFKPLTFNQSVGISADPVRDKAFSLALRLGGGARETFAAGALVLADNAATPEREFKELQNVYQAGAEAFLGIRGSLEGGRLNYEAGTSILLPFLNNDPQNRSATELMRVAAKAQLNISVFTWMSITYSFVAINDPQLIEAWQVQNNLLFNFQYNFIERSDVPKVGESGEPLEERRKREAEEAAKKAAEEAAKAEAEKQAAIEAAKKAEEERKAAEEAAQKAEEERKALEAQPNAQPPQP